MICVDWTDVIDPEKKMNFQKLWVREGQSVEPTQLLETNELKELIDNDWSDLYKTLVLPEELEQIQKGYYIDLEPFLNTSAIAVNEAFSLMVTYSLFRTLGLRHLVVVDEFNHVSGMITRKDLIGQHIEDRMEEVRNKSQHESVMLF